MKFDIWTFLFQVINFVVLLFILKRLLYKPIREIMEKRRGIVEKTIQDAENTKKEALELREKYTEEMKNLQQERTRMLEKLNVEISMERKKLLAKAEEDAARIIEKEKALFNAERKNVETVLKDKALETVSLFSSHLLKDITDEELHMAMYRKFLTELQGIQSDITKMDSTDEHPTVDIFTSYPLTDEMLKTLHETVESIIHKNVVINTAIDQTLLAGVKMKMYDMVYDFSLAGQINALKQRLRETA